MDADLWGLVLSHMSFAQQCVVRATERSARHAHLLLESFSVRRRTTDDGVSYARAVCCHVLKPRSQLRLLTIHHVPLGGEGAFLLSKGNFDLVEELDLTNCSITDVGASHVVWKTKDVPVIILDRNPVDEITFHALMFKLFHLSAESDDSFAVSLRNLPQVSTESVRMLTWGIMQINASDVEAHLSPLDKRQKECFRTAVAPNRFLFSDKMCRGSSESMHFDSKGLPVCTNFKIKITTPLTGPPAPLAGPPPARDRNARRKLPLPSDVKCGHCGYLWKRGSITISQCESYRSQCKLHARPCGSRKVAGSE